MSCCADHPGLWSAQEGHCGAIVCKLIRHTSSYAVIAFNYYYKFASSIKIHCVAYLIQLYVTVAI